MEDKENVKNFLKNLLGLDINNMTSSSQGNTENVPGHEYRRSNQTLVITNVQLKNELAKQKSEMETLRLENVRLQERIRQFENAADEERLEMIINERVERKIKQMAFITKRTAVYLQKAVDEMNTATNEVKSLVETSDSAPCVFSSQRIGNGKLKRCVNKMTKLDESPFPTVTKRRRGRHNQHSSFNLDELSMDSRNDGEMTMDETIQEESTINETVDDTMNGTMVSPASDDADKTLIPEIVPETPDMGPTPLRSRAKKGKVPARQPVSTSKIVENLNMLEIVESTPATAKTARGARRANRASPAPFTPAPAVMDSECNTERRKRSAALKIKSFKEPNSNVKIRRPSGFDPRTDFMLTVRH